MGGGRWYSCDDEFGGFKGCYRLRGKSSADIAEMLDFVGQRSR